MLKYVSTRGAAPELGFGDVLLAGLADDGGLYVPDDVAAAARRLGRAGPALRRRRRRGDVALRRGLDRSSRLRARSSPRPTPPSTTPTCAPWSRSTGLHLLELFHGPTLAFKDVALQLVGRLFDHELTARGEPGHDRGGHLGRHRLGRHRGLRRPRHPRHRRAPPRGPRQRRPAPADDHGRRAQRAQRRRRGHLRRLPGPGEGVLRRRGLPRPGAAVGHELDQLGPRDGAGRLLRHRLRPGARPLLVHGADRQLRQHLLRLDRRADGRPDRPARDRVEPQRHPHPLGRDRRPSWPTRSSRRSARRWTSRCRRTTSACCSSSSGRDGGRTAELLARFRGVGVGRGPRGIPRFDAASVDDEATLEVIRDLHARTGMLVDPHTAVGIGAARRPPARSRRADGVPGHRPPRQVPRRRRAGHRGPPRRCPSAWRTCSSARSATTCCPPTSASCSATSRRPSPTADRSSPFVRFARMDRRCTWAWRSVENGPVVHPRGGPCARPSPSPSSSGRRAPRRHVGGGDRVRGVAPGRGEGPLGGLRELDDPPGRPDGQPDRAVHRQLRLLPARAERDVRRPGGPLHRRRRRHRHQRVRGRQPPPRDPGRDPGRLQAGRPRVQLLAGDERCQRAGPVHLRLQRLRAGAGRPGRPRQGEPVAAALGRAAGHQQHRRGHARADLLRGQLRPAPGHRAPDAQERPQPRHERARLGPPGLHAHSGHPRRLGLGDDQRHRPRHRHPLHHRDHAAAGLQPLHRPGEGDEVRPVARDARPAPRHRHCGVQPEPAAAGPRALRRASSEEIASSSASYSVCAGNCGNSAITLSGARNRNPASASASIVVSL